MMVFITLAIALVVCAGLGGFSVARPKLYRKISLGVMIAGGLLSGFALGVVFTRTVLHQDWRLFPKDLFFFSFFFALLLEWRSREAVKEPAIAAPAPENSPLPAAVEPPITRSYQNVPVEELRAKLLLLEVKHRQQSERLAAQQDWLAGIEAEYQSLMGRFQDAKSDDERGVILETLGRTTEDLNHARVEVRNTEQAFQSLEREIKTVNATLERQEHAG